MDIMKPNLELLQVNYSNDLLANQIYNYNYNLNIFLFILSILVIILLMIFLVKFLVFIYSAIIMTYFNFSIKYIKLYIYL